MPWKIAQNIYEKEKTHTHTHQANDGATNKEKQKVAKHNGHNGRCVIAYTR